MCSSQGTILKQNLLPRFSILIGGIFYGNHSSGAFTPVYGQIATAVLCSCYQMVHGISWYKNSDVSCRYHKNVDLSTLSACCVTSDDMSPTAVTSFAFQRCELCILKRHKDHIWSPLSTPGIRCAADLSSKDDYWGSSQCRHMSSRVDNCFAFRTRMLFEIFPIPMEHILVALVFTLVLVL